MMSPWYWIVLMAACPASIRVGDSWVDALSFTLLFFPQDEPPRDKPKTPDPPPSPSPPPPSQAPSEPRRVEFAEGVAIDWRFPWVELSGRVVLREGPLELFACSPRTREHESILQVGARAIHVYQALGLIGLKPGAPVRYDEKRNAWLAPHGHKLAVRVLHESPYGPLTAPVEAWMIHLEDGKKPVAPIDWVFAGSEVFDDDRFGADVEGTLICVVDFTTALITVGESHSSDDALLWLGANPDFIPREGASCRIVIGDREVEKLILRVDRTGEFLFEREKVALPEILKRWKGEYPEPSPSDPSGRRPRWKIIELQPEDDVDAQALRSAVTTLLKANVPPAALLLDPRRLKDRSPSGDADATKERRER